MKRFLIILLVLFSIQSYSQSVDADSATQITPSSALLYGSHTRGTYDYTVEKDIQIDDNSDFSSPILDWTPCTRSGLILSYQTANIFSPSTQYFYRFRVTLLEYDDESELTIVSSSNSFTTLSIDQASDISFSNIQSSSLTASYSSGSGGNRIVLVKAQ
jgi:hypothetical protein